MAWQIQTAATLLFAFAVVVPFLPNVDCGPDAALRAVVSTEAETAAGRISGVIEDGSYVFRGIPYAAPPVGELRWHRPQPVRPWTGVRDAASFGNVCSQILWGARPPPGDQSEDCLFLNVWTPVLRSSWSLPVLVFVHGGGFVEGSTSTPIYDGRKLSERKGTVVVTVNYRVGPLGFLAHQGLRLNPDGTPLTTGMYGILDQQFALQWVQENIRNFGGNPHAVTVMGESAGACSVCLHLLLPSSRDLFHQAILESGPCTQHFDDDVNWPSLKAATDRGDKLSEALGCSGRDTLQEEIACMRNASASDVLGGLPLNKYILYYKSDGATWFPVVDEVELLDRPFRLVQKGYASQVPLLIGTNSNEGTMFVPRMPLSTDALWGILSEIFGKDAGVVLSQYAGRFVPGGQPVAEVSESEGALDFRNNILLSRVINDWWFLCPSRVLASQAVRGWKDAASTDVFVYEFQHQSEWELSTPLRALGVHHGIEMDYVFGSTYSLELGEDEPFTRSEHRLSHALLGYWSNFVHHGNPMQAGTRTAHGGLRGAAATGGAWEPFASDQFTMRLDVDGRPRHNNTVVNAAAVCDFWMRVGGHALKDTS